MAGLGFPHMPRGAATVLAVTIPILALACGDPAGAPQLGPLVLTITAPDSIVTDTRPAPGGHVRYHCELRQVAALSGGGSEGVIHWEAAEINWRWLSTNELKHSAVWTVRSLSAFWGSAQLESGESRVSELWEFTGTMPFRLDFAFHYQVPGEETARIMETAVRCVGPG